MGRDQKQHHDGDQRGAMKAGPRRETPGALPEGASCGRREGWGSLPHSAKMKTTTNSSTIMIVQGTDFDSMSAQRCGVPRAAMRLGATGAVGLTGATMCLG